MRVRSPPEALLRLLAPCSGRDKLFLSVRPSPTHLRTPTIRRWKVFSFSRRYCSSGRPGRRWNGELSRAGTSPCRPLKRRLTLQSVRQLRGLRFRRTVSTTMRPNRIVVMLPDVRVMIPVDVLVSILIPNGWCDIVRACRCTIGSWLSSHLLAFVPGIVSEVERKLEHLGGKMGYFCWHIQERKNCCKLGIGKPLAKLIEAVESLKASCSNNRFALTDETEIFFEIQKRQNACCHGSLSGFLFVTFAFPYNLVMLTSTNEAITQWHKCSLSCSHHFSPSSWTSLSKEAFYMWMDYRLQFPNTTPVWHESVAASSKKIKIKITCTQFKRTFFKQA